MSVKTSFHFKWSTLIKRWWNFTSNQKFLTRGKKTKRVKSKENHETSFFIKNLWKSWKKKQSFCKLQQQKYMKIILPKLRFQFHWDWKYIEVKVKETRKSLKTILLFSSRTTFSKNFSQSFPWGHNFQF